MKKINYGLAGPPVIQFENHQGFRAGGPLIVKHDRMSEVISTFRQGLKMPRTLINEARKAATNAYCPYSKFHVGAAVKTKSGEIFHGCNIENASYGLTICAERVAIFKAISAGETIKEIAVSCVDAKENSNSLEKMPCGACRQVMAEFLEPESNIYVDGVKTFRLAELLPHGFILKS